MAFADTTYLQSLLGADGLAALVQAAGGLSVDIAKRAPLNGILKDLPEPAQHALARAFGGTTLYVPKCDGSARAARYAAVVAAYDAGERVQDIARRFGITERWVYQILGRPATRAPGAASADACAYQGQLF
ncbi:Mor transcription activator family protein [Rhodoferax sp.]|uniref:Mor transcription activator family protein n=1 Tax=Rhodoferax sp. TaxID=50421 RepID=UPI0026100765|nr:Mor transcription activator family protein [Rhodoferax sp.]MDD3938028.1 Mor transcription activator family protein [Rhodoferax sp.]